MSDGRSVGQFWVSNSILQERLKEKYGLKNDEEYKKFLQKNTDKVREDLLPLNEMNIEKCPVCQQALAYKPMDVV